MTRHPRTRRFRSGGLVPALPRPAWVVLGGDFVSAVGSGLTLPCLFLYAHRVRHLGYGTAGLVVATIALASLAGNPAGGALADRWTPRRALMAGLAVAAAGSAALAVARTAPELFAAAGLLGLGVSVLWPAQDALLASLAGPARRPAVFSVRHACLNAGLGVGALAAAAVISVARPATFTAAYAADGDAHHRTQPTPLHLRHHGRGDVIPDSHLALRFLYAGMYSRWYALRSNGALWAIASGVRPCDCGAARSLSS